MVVIISIVAVVDVYSVIKCQVSTCVAAVLVSPNSYSCVVFNESPVKLNFVLPLFEYTFLVTPTAAFAIFGIKKIIAPIINIKIHYSSIFLPNIDFAILPTTGNSGSSSLFALTIPIIIKTI